jgi:hypothetical protein
MVVQAPSLEGRFVEAAGSLSLEFYFIPARLAI